jgi:periplasmic copper chaperone A
MRPCWVALLLLVALALAACGATGLQVQNAWVRPVLAGNTDAAYLVIRNPGGANDRLLRVECESATAVEIHTRVDRNGVMEMRPIDSWLDIPTNGEIVFGSGGMHIMLIGMKQDLVVGDTLALTLYFEQYGPMQVVAQVRVS